MAITVYKQKKTIYKNLKKKYKIKFSSKSWNGEEFTKLRPEENHKIAGITNCEITKCQDPLYMQSY